MSQYNKSEGTQGHDYANGGRSGHPFTTHSHIRPQSIPTEINGMAEDMFNQNSDPRLPRSKRVNKTSDGLLRHIYQILHTGHAVDDTEKGITLREYWEDDLDNISVTAGLLALASYSLVTSDLSNTNLSVFSPTQVQILAAWTVALFVGVIVLCQQQKFSLRDDFRDESRAYKTFRCFAAICLRPVIAFMFQAALLLLFLTSSAFVWHVGLLFTVLDGIWIAWSLLEWTWWFSITFPRIRRESLRKGDDKATSKSDQADDAKDKGPHLPNTVGEIVFNVISSVFCRPSEPDAIQGAEVGKDVP